MSNLSKGTNRAQEKNVFLSNSKNNPKNQVPATVLVGHVAKLETTKEEKPDIQDAVIVQEETAQATNETQAEVVTVKEPVTAGAMKASAEPSASATAEMNIPLSIERIMEKAEKLYKYKSKYTEIQAKIKEVEEFEIGHDSQNAQLTLVDTSGRTIRTSNPMSIGKVLEDWKHLLIVSLEEKEKEIRNLLAEA